MKRLCGLLLATVCLTGCFQRAEQNKDDFGVTSVNYEALGLKKKTAVKKKAREFASYTEGASDTDRLHADLPGYPATEMWQSETDSIFHYPTGKKIEVGVHGGEILYLELGEFYDDLTYNGAKVWLGDSLIYSTGLEVVNDWQTCHVHHVGGDPGVTYVLLMIDDRPNPAFWHILSLDGDEIHLADHVLAGNDYVEGARYFHDSVIHGDLDGDGLIEVGGKYWTEHWADSMSYNPCLIYKLDRTLRLDEALSEHETKKAYGGLFFGLESQDVYNPNEEQHEHFEEQPE